MEFEYDIYDNEIGIFNIKGDYGKEITIPESLVVDNKSFPVVFFNFGWDAINENKNIKIEKLHILNNIQNFIIDGNENIKEIFLESNNTEFEIDNCNNLEKIEITGKFNNFESGQFRNCFNLKTIIINVDSEISINCRAFKNCYKLESIIINGKPYEPIFGEKCCPSAFWGCGNYKFFGKQYLIEDNFLLSKDKTICYTFLGKTKKVITLPNTIKDIYHYFNDEGIEVIDLSKTKIKEIDSDGFVIQPFHKSSSLKKVILPDSVERIGERAFFDNIELKEINLPKNLKSIEFAAFSNTGIISLEFPESLEYIGENAFIDCKNLNRVKIPESINSIEKKTFMGCSGLEEINLPSKLEKIGELAFCECKNLKKIEFPKYMEELGEACFQKSGLISIKISSNIEDISYYAFSECENLQKLFLPTTIKNITTTSFIGCKSIKEVFISEGYSDALSKIFDNSAEIEFTFISKYPRSQFRKIYNPKKYKSKYGIINLETGDIIIPIKFDEIIILSAPLLKDNLQTGITSKNTYFICYNHNSKEGQKIRIFDENGIRLDKVSYTHIFPIALEKTFYKQREYDPEPENQYGIRTALKQYWTEKNIRYYFSGWFLSLNKDNTPYLHYNNESFCVPDLEVFFHPEGITMLLLVKTAYGKGILSPYGWIVEPTHKLLSFLMSDDIFHRESITSMDFKRILYFIVDNEIIKVKYSQDKMSNYTNGYINGFEITTLFPPNQDFILTNIISNNLYYKNIIDGTKWIYDIQKGTLSSADSISDNYFQNNILLDDFFKMERTEQQAPAYPPYKLEEFISIKNDYEPDEFYDIFE